MDPLTLAIIAGAGLSIFGSLWSGYKNRQSVSDTNLTNLQIARETNAHNERLADKSNAWNLQMWNRYNDYTSPANQMALLREAGLNPNLAYGSLGSAFQSIAPQSAVTPTAQQSASMMPQQYNNPFESIANIPTAIAQLQNTEAQTKNIETATAGVGLDNQKKAIELPYAEKGIQLQQSLMNESIKQIQQGIAESVQKVKNLITEQGLTEAQAIGQIWQNDYNKKAEKGMLDAIDWNNKLMQSNIKLNDAQINHYTAMSLNLAWDNLLKGSQIELNKEQASRIRRMTPYEIEKISAETNNLITQGGLMEKEFELFPMRKKEIEVNIRKASTEADLNEKEKNWYAFNAITRGVANIGIGVGSAMGGLKSGFGAGFLTGTTRNPIGYQLGR